MKTSTSANYLQIFVLLFPLTSGLMKAEPQTETKPKIGTARQLRQEEVSAVVTAIEDEIYDRSQEGSFFRTGGVGKARSTRTAKVVVYINPVLAADGLGWAIYQDLPYGEIIRAFYFKANGMVVLAGGPQIGFPVTQPSHFTEFMDEDELGDDKALWLHADLTLERHPSKSTLIQAARRQLMRVGFSDYLRSTRRDLGKGRS